MKPTELEQFPKNKNISLLSNEQIKLRKNISNKPKLKIKSKVCIKCSKILPLSEFYYKKAWLGENG